MDKKRILITPLYGVGGKLHYYFNENDDRATYCDALLSAEASCKYVLANHQIDEIITFGSKSTYDPGDDLKSCVLKEGSSFYASDINSMSTYSLFRYRLAQYLDEINVEEQDIRELLDADAQKAVTDYIKDFFRKYNSDGTKRSNRFFDHLMKDPALRNDLISGMREAIPGFKNAEDNYTTWAFQYLYNSMKDSFKMELLEGNSDIRIRFVPAVAGGTASFVETFTRIMKGIYSSDTGTSVEIYMCIQSDDASDTFVMMNIMNLIKTMPDSTFRIARIITTTRNPDGISCEILDDTDKFTVTDLIAGIRAFLRYGKTDMLLDYWNMTGRHNTKIERLLYAMRNIDTGISLCDISDIERGIDSLRKLFSENVDLGGDSFAEYFFGMTAEGIRHDYGDLLRADALEFIDLVKWAYGKGFWQQTLTLIESRAPNDFVNRGFFYYSNSPSCSESVLKILGQVYYDLKPYEKYKLEDVAHYFIKAYSRGRAQRKKDARAYQMEYAKLRVGEITENNPDIIRAHTICPDKEALTNLLFAYYYVGDVRNATNHAMEDFSGFLSIMSDSDVSERMNTISQAIDYFIHCYDVVRTLVSESGEVPDVDIIEPEKVVEYSMTLRPKFEDRHGSYRRHK